MITNRRMVLWTRWQARGRLLRTSVESLVFGDGSYVDLATRPFAGTEVGDIVVRDDRGRRVFKLAGALYPYHVAGVLAEAVRSSGPAGGPVRVSCGTAIVGAGPAGGAGVVKRLAEALAAIHLNAVPPA